MRKNASKKRWMQSAVKKPGAFTEWCKKRGYKGVTKKCIEEGKASKNPTTVRRATLAETFRKANKKRKKKRK